MLGWCSCSLVLFPRAASHCASTGLNAAIVRWLWHTAWHPCHPAGLAAGRDMAMVPTEHFAVPQGAEPLFICGIFAWESPSASTYLPVPWHGDLGLLGTVLCHFTKDPHSGCFCFLNMFLPCPKGGKKHI